MNLCAMVISEMNRKMTAIIDFRVTELYNEDRFCIYHDEVIQSPQVHSPTTYGQLSLSQMAAVCIKTAKSVLSPEVYL